MAALGLELKVWEVEGGREVRSLGAPGVFFSGLALSPSGKRLATGGCAGSRSTRTTDGKREEVYTPQDVDSSVLLWDLALAGHRRELEPRARQASRHLAEENATPDDLRVVGEWYAAHGEWTWARLLLQEASTAGAAPSPLLVARCCWQAGDLDGARAAFARAAERGEAPEEYIGLCERALRR